mgnify:CR=1 FL=1
MITSVAGREYIMDKQKILKAVSAALEEKGKRKFRQSVEVIVNFRGIDFSKPENRLNLDVVLPNGKGKEPKIAVFADGALAAKARSGGFEVIDAKDIPGLAQDKARLTKYLKEYEFLAQPNLMTTVAKSLGQVLSRKGKLPMPLMNIQLEQAALVLKKRVKVATKGKQLPVVQCIVGKEDMEPQQLVDNVTTVIDKILTKVPEHNFKSIYVKLTMGKPIAI